MEDEGAFSVGWSPDGRRLAAGYMDGTIRVWDASSGYRDAPREPDIESPWSRVRRADKLQETVSAAESVGNRAEADAAFARLRALYEGVLFEQPEAHLVRQQLLDLWLNTAYRLHERSDPAAGDEAFRQAVALSNEIVRRWGQRENLIWIVDRFVNLARKFDRAGRRLLAATVYKAAVEQRGLFDRPVAGPYDRGRYADFLLNTAKFFMQAPDALDYELAVRLLREALAPGLGAEAQQGLTWTLLGWACYRTGDWKGSAAATARGIELFPPAPLHYYFLAMATWRLGDKAQAQGWHRKAELAMKQRHGQRDRALFLELQAEAAALLGPAWEVAPPPRPAGPDK